MADFWRLNLLRKLLFVVLEIGDMSDLARPLGGTPTERPDVFVLIRKQDGRNAAAEFWERAIDRLLKMKKPGLPLAG